MSTEKEKRTWQYSLAHSLKLDWNCSHCPSASSSILARCPTSIYDEQKEKEEKDEDENEKEQ